MLTTGLPRPNTTALFNAFFPLGTHSRLIRAGQVNRVIMIIKMIRLIKATSVIKLIWVPMVIQDY